MPSKPTLQFISGLGTDKRVFSRLDIDNRFKKNYAEWIMPLENETLTAYTKRMIDQYQIREGDILVGLSFGGMVSVEVSKQVKVKQLILLSSTATTGGLSPIILWAGKLGLTKYLPKSRFNKPNPFNYFAFGAKTEDEKEKIDMFISEGNTDLNYWSVKKLANWRNDRKPNNTLIITGDEDKIFPVNRSNPDFVIEGATHLMVYTHAKEVSEIISRKLQEF